jgi:phosphohistidine swiveling domain-containing protein
MGAACEAASGIMRAAMRWLVPLAEAHEAARFGRKAAELAVLGALSGVDVPAGFVLDAAAFEVVLRSALPTAQWPEALLAGAAVDRRATRLAAIRQRLLAAPLPDALEAELALVADALGGRALAVRSSGLHEDATMASAAGLQESFLGVRGATALVDAVRRCWGSLYAERALTYLARQRGASPVGMAVLIQVMVEAECAGVLFTADPLDGGRGVAVIEATRGLGVAVVDGRSTPEVLRVRRRDRVVVQRTAVSLAVATVVADGGGLREEALPEASRGAPVVTDALLAGLLTLADRVEARAGEPRDIEWAWDGRALWLLQSRSIVGLPGAGSGARSLDDRRGWVWSNVNVGEALPGVATPLTWSIAVAFSERGFRKAFAGLGCEVTPELELVGIFHGRIYLNLTNFVRVARQVPLLSPKMLIELGGGSGLEAVEQQVGAGSWWPFVRRLPRTVGVLASENFGLETRLRRFEDEFAEARARFAALPFAIASRVVLRQGLRDARALLDHTGELMLTCASGYLASVVAMRELLRRVLPAETDRHERELLAGFADLESAAPGIALVHIAEIARREPAARAAILGGDPLALTVGDLPAGPTRRAFESFLKAYGFRCPREAELATPRWREAPGTLFVAMRAHLQQSDDRAIGRVERQLRLRAEAEESLAARLPPVARSGARHLLARTQRFARLRERMRARVTEVLGFVRMVALEASARLAHTQGSKNPDGAFYLTVDELDAWLGGELTDAEAVIAIRRAEVARDRARPDPPASFVGSPPSVAPSPEPVGDRFTGVAASPGVVTGRVRVLREPGDGALLTPGEVLVTAVADVGWTPLFLVATAVVTELGGALSHAALVAREYGVPAVVNVAGATRALKTGDRVRVDGDRGVVERLECV